MSALSNLDSMLAAWNEKDPKRVRGHLDAALSPDVLFVDPDNHVVGIDAFEAMVHKLIADIPDVKAERTSGFSHHHNRYHYTWLVSSGDTPLQKGMDVTEVDDAGKIVRVDGFFGDLPPLDG
ncbi:MAG: nuclear transport factor 2 family protein [Candidatus Phaeomarinobacter sp.]